MIDLETFSSRNFPRALAVRYPFRYRGLVTKVRDADTVEALLDLGVDVRHEIAVRFSNFSGPELHEDGGAEAAECLRAWLPVGKPVGVESEDLLDEDYSFRRLVGRVYVEYGNVTFDVGEAMGRYLKTEKPEREE